MIRFYLTGIKVISSQSGIFQNLKITNKTMSRKNNISCKVGKAEVKAEAPAFAEASAGKKAEAEGKVYRELSKVWRTKVNNHPFISPLPALIFESNQW